jgi:hypothetical protein
MKAIEILADLLPTLVRWVASEISAGRDPKAQLDALMGAADLAVDALEDAKFPKP